MIVILFLAQINECTCRSTQHFFFHHILLYNVGFCDVGKIICQIYIVTLCHYLPYVIICHLASWKLTHANLQHQY